MTAGDGVTIDFGAPAATYGTTGIAAHAPGIVHGGRFYAGEGDAVSLGLSATPPSGKVLDAYAASAGTLSQSGDGWTLAMSAAAVVVNATWQSAGIYSIENVASWNEFADAVNGGMDTAGMHVNLTADIGPVTQMIGTADHPFRGVFRGNGHTLTVDIRSTEPCAAPFSQIDGATVSNLTVRGTVASTNFHAAGLVGGCGDDHPNTIADCTVSVAVSDAPYAGGIVGHGGEGVLTLDGCVFSGVVSGFANYAGGLLGWCDALALTITNCLCTGTFTPVGGGKYHPIACKYAVKNVIATVADAYYLNTIVPTTIGNNLIPGAEGTPVNATYDAIEWQRPVTAADGNVYYCRVPDLHDPPAVVCDRGDYVECEVGESQTFVFTAENFEAAYWDVWVNDNYQNNEDVDGNTATFTWVPEADGLYNIDAQATDSSGVIEEHCYVTLMVGEEPEPFIQSLKVEGGKLKMHLAEPVAKMLRTADLVNGPWEEFDVSVGENCVLEIPMSDDMMFYRAP